jgi:NADH dehydrogenase
MAALEELTRGILLRHYPSIPADAVRLVLVGSAILPQTATNLAAYAKERLLGRGIELETARAAKVSADGLELQDGRLITCHCVIWTAGNRVNSVVTALPVAKAKDGRLLVNEFFEVQGAPGAYALGDNAAQPDTHTGESYVATAQVALRQGRALAAQIEADLTGRARRPFRFKLLGEMVPLSRPHGMEAHRVSRVVRLEDGLHAQAADPGDARARGLGLDGGAVLRARCVRADRR